MKEIDLFIYNGFTPRRRSPGDVFLDNGIGMLRAYFKKNNMDFVLEDRIGIDSYVDFDLPEISVPLRELCKKVIYSKNKGSLPRQFLDKFKLKGLYTKLVRYQDAVMRQYLGQLRDRIADMRPPVVGMKVWFGITFNYCKMLCDMIQEASPETIVVAGGPLANCYNADGVILKYTPFDLAVYSEGEIALTQIVRIAKRYNTKKERLEAIISANIPNLVYRTPDGIVRNPIQPLPINEKLIPDYEGDYNNKVMNHTIIDALGCDYGKCYFCIHPKIHPHFRLRDPKLVVDEIEYMIRRGIGFFTFTASDTPLPHARRISEEILRRKLNLEFTILARGSKGAAKRKQHLVDSYRTIIRAGMRILYMGAESGNDDVLRDVLNKNLTAQDIADTIECIRKASDMEGKKVYIITSYIYPIPLTDGLLKSGITFEKVLEDNITLGKRTQPDSFQVMPATVYTGVDWYNNARRYNIELDKEKYAKSMLELETSPHAIFDKPPELPFKINGRGFHAWVNMYLKICRAANDAGLPSELNDEHLVIGRSVGCKSAEELTQLSRDLFLDIISCNGERSGKFFRMTNKKSREIAGSNNLSKKSAV